MQVDFAGSSVNLRQVLKQGGREVGGKEVEGSLRVEQAIGSQTCGDSDDGGPEAEQ